MAAIDFTDQRVQTVLRGIREHPDCSLSETWLLYWKHHFTGWHGKGQFNHGFIERMLPRLIKGGLVVRGEKYRLALTTRGLDAIIKRG